MDGSIFVVDVVFNFSGKPAKTNAPTFGVVLVVPTGWFPEKFRVGLFSGTPITLQTFVSELPKRPFECDSCISESFIKFHSQVEPKFSLSRASSGMLDL